MCCFHPKKRNEEAIYLENPSDTDEKVTGENGEDVEECLGCTLRIADQAVGETQKMA